MGDAISLLVAWAQKHDVALVLALHMPKAEGRDGGAGDLAAIRGASAIGGGIRIGFTVTELKAKMKDRVPPDVRDRIMQITSSKGNHQGKVDVRFGERRVIPLETVDLDGSQETQHVAAFRPYKLDLGWNPADDNNRLRVIHAIADATAEGKPLRVKAGTKSGALSGAEILADDWDEDARAIADTFAGLLRDGFVVSVKSERDGKGNYPKVWAVTPRGRAWMEEKSRVGFDAIEGEAPPAPSTDDSAEDDPWAVYQGAA
jgi:hypothetical protein